MNAPPRMVVSNSSPLIALAAIGRLELLKSLFGEIVIPQAVVEEVVVQGQGEPGINGCLAAAFLLDRAASHLPCELPVLAASC